MVDRWKIVTEKRRGMKEAGHKTIGEIAAEHGVDRNTVRRALRRIQKDGDRG
jgi:hypothetical protein